MSKEEIIEKVTQEKLKNVAVMKPFLKNKLNIPDYLKFGFEIEALILDEKIQSDMVRYKYHNFFDNGNFQGVSEMIEYEENEYGGVDDCRGGEIVTPILRDCEESWLDIKKACEYLAQNARLTNRCSVHTNIGAEALGSDYKNWYNFCKIIAACECEIYRYLSNGKEIRSCAIDGRFRNAFAMPIAEKLRKGLEKSSNENVGDINTLLNNCGFNGDYQYRKDKSISIKGIYQTDNETIPEEELDESLYGRRIEFRMANGTFSAVEIQNHLYIISRIIETSRNLTTEKNRLLDELLGKPLPEDYNERIDILRAIDVANILFDTREDKLQFLFTVCEREKVSESLDDKEKLLRLIRQEYMVLELASDELKSDKSVVIEAVKHGGAQLQYVSEELKNDKEIVLIAVKKYGRALQFASEELKKNKEVVLEAVKSNGFALQYASEELRGDKEIILEALKRGKGVLQYANEEVLFEKGFFSILYQDNDIVYNYLSSNHIEDETSFIEQMNNDEIIYKYCLQEAIDGNEEMVQYVLKAFYNFNCENWDDRKKRKYYNIAEEEKYKKIATETLDKIRQGNNHKLFLEIIDTDTTLFRYFTPEEKKQKDIVLTVLKNEPGFFQYVCPELRNDKQVVLLAVNSDGTTLRYASEELKGDKEVAMAAIKEDPYSIWYISEELKRDREIALEIIKNSKYLLKLMSEEVQNDPVILEALENQRRQEGLRRQRHYTEEER